jgi:hypothetical protein
MRRLVLVVLAALVLVSCTQEPEGIAVVANGQQSIGLGAQRMLIGYRGDDGTDLADPSTPIGLELTSPSGVTSAHPVEFIWMIEGVRGLYVATVEFDEAGIWNAVLSPEGGPPTIDSPFMVEVDSIVRDVGEPAIASITATLDDSTEEDLSDITTDPDPDPGLYAESLDVLLSNGKPTVLVFATPAFCQTATCGPMLGQVRALRDELGSDSVDWVHVEVYTNLDNPEELELVPAVIEWNLPSEPWTFVIDGAGIITARLEGAMSDAELRSAVEAVLP